MRFLVVTNDSNFDKTSLIELIDKYDISIHIMYTDSQSDDDVLALSKAFDITIGKSSDVHWSVKNLVVLKKDQTAYDKIELLVSKIEKVKRN